MEGTGDGEKKDVRRPMNAFLIFCKRHRSIVREKNPDLDNRSVTRILGDLWANLKDEEKTVYTDLAKQYKDAFMKANPDYKWHNPEKGPAPGKQGVPKPTNMKVIRTDMDMLLDGSIMPGKLADPSNMGGLSLLLKAGEQADGRCTSPVPVSEPTTKSQPRDTGLPATETMRKPVWETNLRLDGHDRPDMTSQHFLPTKLGDSRGSDTVKQTWGQCLPKVDSAVKANDSTRPGQLVAMDRRVNSNANTSIVDRGTQRDTNAILMMDKVRTIPADVKRESPDADSSMPAHRVFLTEALRETCDKGSLSEIVKRGNSPLTLLHKDGVKLEHGASHSVQSLQQRQDDMKQNLTQLMVTDVKEEGTGEDDSSLVPCGKLVVNHIIDRLFSSDRTAAARLAAASRRDPGATLMVDTGYLGRVAEHEARTNTDVANEPVNTPTPGLVPTSEPGRIVPLSNYNTGSKPDVRKTFPLDSGCFDSQTVKPAVKKAMKRKLTKSETISVSPTPDTKPSESSYEPLVRSDTDHAASNCRASEAGSTSPPSPPQRDSWSGEERDDTLPVRKSRRRNRGQRYQELINEGIIQPSKERLAAKMQDKLQDADNSAEEEFQCIDTHILPETAIRRIRKRTTSESAKDGLLSLEDARRYKTGDFDLEAHIASLPVCPVESLGRKRIFVRSRHNSESVTSCRKSSDEEVVFDPKQTVSLPPRVKIPTPERSREPVIGSRKRKARKHSINHLLPAPVGKVPNVQGYSSDLVHRTSTTGDNTSPVQDMEGAAISDIDTRGVATRNSSIPCESGTPICSAGNSHTTESLSHTVCEQKMCDSDSIAVCDHHRQASNSVRLDEPQTVSATNEESRSTDVIDTIATHEPSNTEDPNLRKLNTSATNCDNHTASNTLVSIAIPSTSRNDKHVTHDDEYSYPTEGDIGQKPHAITVDIVRPELFKTFGKTPETFDGRRQHYYVDNDAPSCKTPLGIVSVNDGISCSMTATLGCDRRGTTPAVLAEKLETDVNYNSPLGSSVV